MEFSSHLKLQVILSRLLIISINATSSTLMIEMTKLMDLKVLSQSRSTKRNSLTILTVMT